MALEIKTKEIEGIPFEVTQLGFKEGRGLFVRLAKSLGPSLASVAEGAADLRSLPLADMLRKAIENVSDQDLEAYAAALGKVTRYSLDGGRTWPFLDAANREVLFSGRLLLFFRWLAWAVEVQFGDFFAALEAPAATGLERPNPQP